MLWEAIAEKSFQYSHIMRKAPKKGVMTRSRATIRKIDHQIACLYKLYGRNRGCMVRLSANAATLATFRSLTPADVKSSTAILDPNQPGSKKLKLSWIWQINGGAGMDDSPEALMECRWP